MNTDDLDDDTFHLLAGINRSARYHDRRRMFYENWNSVTAVLGAVGLTAGGIQVYDVSHLWAYVLGVGALWCAIDGALGVAKKAVTHAGLAVRFVLLEKVFASGENLTKEQIEKIRKQRLELESSEPPLLYLLNELCQISYERSIGAETNEAKLPWWRKCLVYLLSQEEYTRENFRQESA